VPISQPAGSTSSRHARSAADDLQVLEQLGAGVGVIDEPVDADLLEPGPRLVRIARVDIDRDHLEGGAAELAFERLECRHFLAARHAPGGPQVEQHRSPVPVRQVPLGPGSVPEGDIGKPQRLLGCDEGGHFSAGERRDSPGGLERPGAGRIRRIAREGTDPVYRRERDDPAGRDHGEPSLGGGSRCFFRSGHIRRNFSL
jgi:hypothetical protein